MNNKTDREIMQQALEALEVATTPLAKDRQEVLRAQAALLKRLAQPEREWQGLFFDAVYEAWHSAGMDVLGGDWNTFASKLEEKLKETK